MSSFARQTLAALLIAALGFSALLFAQGGTLRGQIYGPDGKALKGEVRFQIVSSDGNFQQIYFSDSNGRIIVPGLRAGITYTLTVDGDGSSYDSARETFNLETVQYLNVFLREPAAKEPRRASPETVSLESLGRQVPAAAARSYLEGMKRIRANRLADSVRPLQQAISSYPAFFEARNDLGVVLMKLDRLAEAEKLLRQAAEIRPEDPRPWLNLGMVLIRSERHAEAVESLQNSLRLKPGFPDSLRHLGEALLEIGRLDEAETALSAAAEAGDDNRPVALIKLAIVKVQKNENPAAVALLQQYLAEFPKASNRAEIEAILKQLRP